MKSRIDRFIRARQGIRKPYRIFVNRNLHMETISLVGFDLDYTLAVYRKELIERLGFQETIRKMIAAGYPESIQKLEYDPLVMIRGLVIDKKLGNILKMNQFGMVGRAHHGLRMLPTDEVRRLYSNRRIRVNDPRHHSVDTLFDLPAAHLYSQLVDHLESHQAKKGVALDPWKLFDDMLAALDLSHRDGSIKRHIMKDPGRYLIRDTALALTLDRIRDSGKRVVLITNSEWEYTNSLLDYLLTGVIKEYGVWTSYFDRVIVDARKPTFFQNAAPFLDLEGRELPSKEVAGHKILRSGNSRLFQKMEDAWGDEILFVGDHIYGDILRSKKTHGWRTAMIVEELESEILSSNRARTLHSRLKELELQGNLLDYDRHRIQRRLDHLESEESRSSHRGLAFLRSWDEAKIDRYAQRYRQRLAEIDMKIRKNVQEREALQQAYDATYNPNWGPLMRERNEVSRFGQQVKSYACLYTSRVTNLLSYPMDKIFHSPIEQMPHDLE